MVLTNLTKICYLLYFTLVDRMFIVCTLCTVHHVNVCLTIWIVTIYTVVYRVEPVLHGRVFLYEPG